MAKGDAVRIIWSSNSIFGATGYSSQTRVFVPRLQKMGHEMATIAWYGVEGGMLNWNGIPVYPKGYHDYGADVLVPHAKHFGADIAVTLIDSWVLPPSLMQGTRWVSYYPVDMEPIPPPVKRAVEAAWARIVYSKFGQRMTEDAGLDCHYVPHAVDTSIFHPFDKAECRRKLGVPPDCYLVTMVAANKGNPSRKAFPQQLEAFARFAKQHPDARIYLHTTRGENGEMGGVNLPELAESLGIADKVLWADPYALLIGLPDEYMAGVYAASDVLLSASLGEGFGIPILEAQACGTPVIVGDWTSMSELCFGGWMVPKDDNFRFYTPLAAYQYLPSVGAVHECLEAAYRASDDTLVKDAARAGAMAYDADLVAETFWRPTLAEFERRIQEEKDNEAMIARLNAKLGKQPAEAPSGPVALRRRA